jgi:Reverse transcriptase (RNA-dependent DNA polymerase)
MIAALQGLQILLIDIDNTYLYSKIDVEVYMTQPSGYIDPRYLNHVCKLLKGLYSLKQAGRIWHRIITTYVEEIGFKTTLADLCVFT